MRLACTDLWERRRPPRSVQVCDRPASFWIELYVGCCRPAQGGYEQWAWPDGKPLLDQPRPLVEIFRAISAEQVEIMKRKDKAEALKRKAAS